MSRCYDFQKWTMISLEMVALSLTVGLVLVNFAHGQNYAFDPLLTKCVVHKDDHLVILDLTRPDSVDCTIYYVAQGYEIKASAQTLLYLQK